VSKTLLVVECCVGPPGSAAGRVGARARRDWGAVCVLGRAEVVGVEKTDFGCFLSAAFIDWQSTGSMGA
jgi:hypothetical protein